MAPSEIDGEKDIQDTKGPTPTEIAQDVPEDVQEGTQRNTKLARDLQGRHMQMIAIGTLP